MEKTITALPVFILFFITPIQSQINQDHIFGGYGELHYNDVIYDKNAQQSTGVIDFHRFVLAADYHFNEWISLQSELRLGHTLLESDYSSELVLDQAFVDLNLLAELNLRTGIIPVPLGIVNRSREPTTFHGVERPNVEQFIIPSTWRESGVGLFGNIEKRWEYEMYFMAGLDPSGITGQEGIRQARQNGFRSTIKNFALAGRLAYTVNEHFKLSASYYLSTLSKPFENDTTDNQSSIEGAIFNMGEGHFIYEKNRFEARGLFALSRILDVEDLNRTYSNGAGQIQAGGYLQLAYDLLPFFADATKQQLWVFSRYESFDTNFVTGEIPRTNEFLRDEITAGFSYKPDPRVIFKLDYQLLTSFVGSRHIQQLNLGMGYTF